MGWTEADYLAHIERFNRMTGSEVASAMEKMPTDALEFGVRFEALANAEPRVSKYGNQLTTVDGHTFKSKLESEHYQKLDALQRMNLIRELKLQPRFVLQDTVETKWGKKLRPIVYVGDFEFYDASGQRTVVDSKGCRTAAYRIKAKWFQASFPDIKFEEW